MLCLSLIHIFNIVIAVFFYVGNQLVRDFIIAVPSVCAGRVFFPGAEMRLINIDGRIESEMCIRDSFRTAPDTPRRSSVRAWYGCWRIQCRNRPLRRTDVYKRQGPGCAVFALVCVPAVPAAHRADAGGLYPVSYTHLAGKQRFMRRGIPGKSMGIPA